MLEVVEFGSLSMGVRHWYHTAMSELEWRETVAGVYWKAGAYRVEKLNLAIRGSRFVAVKFMPDWRESEHIGFYATLQEAKDACQQEEGA